MRRGLMVPWEIVVLMVTCVALVIALRSAQDRARRAGFRADSLAVAADTLRVRHLGELDLWQRRVQQGEIDRTRLEAKLKQRPAVVLQPVLQVDTVRLVDTVPVVGDTVRRATFLKYQRPVTLSAVVTMPSSPGHATLDATLVVDTLPLTVRVTCGPARDGVRPVTASVTTPGWVTLRLGTPAATPEVCNRVTRRGLPWWSLLVAGGVGALLR